MRGGRNVLYLFIFFLTMINYADRVALSIGSKAISDEFHLTPVQMGYLLSSFTWTYVIFLLPWGTAVDRIGPRRVSMIGMGLWSSATVITGLAFKRNRGDAVPDVVANGHRPSSPLLKTIVSKIGDLKFAKG